MVINRQGSASFIQTSAPASLPLQLVSSSFLTGSVGSEPSYTGAQTLGLVSGANIVGQSLFTSSGSTVSITAGIIALSGVDFFAAPPCSLQISLTSSYSVLYLWKKTSGAAAETTQIGLLPTSGASDAQDALSMAQSALNGVYVPLCVLSADSQANQSIEWSLDSNSQYSSPILDQLGQISSWQGNTKTFIETQLSALTSDLTGFASWEQEARNNQIEITFSIPGGQNLSGMQYALAGAEYVENGVMSPAAFIFSNYLAKFVQLVPGGIQNTTSSDSTGNYLQQIHGTGNGNDFWFAPSQTVSFPVAWSTTSSGGFVKGVQWQTDGNLYFTFLSPGEQDFPVPCGLYLEDGVTLNRYNGSQQVATLPPNPLANPTFQTGW